MNYTRTSHARKHCQRVFILSLTCRVERSEARRVAVVVADEGDDGEVALRHDGLRAGLDAARVVVGTLAHDESVGRVTARVRRTDGQLEVSESQVDHLQTGHVVDHKGHVVCGPSRGTLYVDH